MALDRMFQVSTKLEYLKKVRNILTADVSKQEDKLLSSALPWDLKQIWKYKRTIVRLQQQLRLLSKYVFQETDIAHVRLYKSTEIKPEDYQDYENIANNLPVFVVFDVLIHNKPQLSLLTMERWIAVCHLSFECGDYFTAAHIMYGLFANPLMTRSDLHRELSGNIATLYREYSKLFASNAKISQLHEAALHAKDKCIPILPVLAHVLDHFKEITTQAVHPVQKQLVEANQSVATASYIKLKTQLSNPLPEELRNAHQLLTRNVEARALDELFKQKVEHFKIYDLTSLGDQLSKLELVSNPFILQKRNPTMFFQGKSKQMHVLSRDEKRLKI